MAVIKFDKEDKILQPIANALFGDNYKDLIELIHNTIFPTGASVASPIFIPFMAILYGLLVGSTTIFWYLILVPILFVFTVIPVFIATYVVGIFIGLLPFTLKDLTPPVKTPLSKTYTGIDVLQIPIREWTMSGLASVMYARDFGSRPAEWFKEVRKGPETNIIKTITLFIANTIAYPLYCFILFPLDFALIYLGIIIIGIISFVIWTFLALFKPIINAVIKLFK